MKHLSYYISRTSLLLMAVATTLASCTDKFEGMNINPVEVTPGQMEQDNLNVGAFFTQMEKGVLIVGKDMGGEYQITEMLTGDIFASYIANINTYGYTAYHNDHYALYRDWYNAPFNDAYTNIMQPWKSIVDNTDETSVARAMATVVKVLGMNRITDMYGPIPYSKFGKNIKVAYDSQKDIYYSFFDELDNAISVMTDYTTSNTKPYMAKYDYIYSGNISKWIKLANTLRLRLAMRISYVDEDKARTEAQAAIAHAGGLITTKADAAILHQSSTLSYVNPIWEVCESFKDMRMSATMDCYLNGLEDPRIEAYFTPAANGEYHGARNGMTDINKDAWVAAASSVNIAEGSDLTWMNAAESWFLMAEAKLRFGLGTSTVREYYEQGVHTSFDEHGCKGVAAYLADDTKTPLTSYINPVTERSTSVKKMVSKLCVAWDESANQDKKMERIMTQKWIALFPNGQEAWSEMRRTGYPGIIKIQDNESNGEVKSGALISRLKFPTTEYSDNPDNTQAAIQLLGGNDTAGQRLWWDVKRKDNNSDDDDWDWDFDW